jgi:acetyl esterase/lipase
MRRGRERSNRLRAASTAVLTGLCLLAAGVHGEDAAVETDIPPVPDAVPGASYRPPRPLDGAKNFLDVCYLPKRLAGAWEDRWVTMNVHVPPRGGPYPCLIFIHGGGYGGGDKDFKFGRCGACSTAKTWQRAIREGYVVVNLNYILSYGGSSRPEVFYDFRAAVRFLRANAKRFRIDPGRIAAWGFSAGGWLCSSAGLSEADDQFRVRAEGIPGHNKKQHFFHAAGAAAFVHFFRRQTGIIPRTCHPGRIGPQCAGTS